jgi:hypothetical protein
MNRCLRIAASIGVASSLCVAVGAAEAVGATATAESNPTAAIGPSAPARFEAGIALRFMPIGWFDLYDAFNRDFRAYPALGLAPFLDFRIGRYITVGLSPELTLIVIPNRQDYLVGHMLAAMARLQIRYPEWGRFEPDAIASGGYSVIWRTSGRASNTNSATGPLAGGTVGVRLKFARRQGVFAELGYQKGFQRLDGQAYGPSYLITGAGWQVGF